MKKTKLLQIMMLLALTLVFATSASAISVDVLSTDPAPLQAGEFADITIQIESSINEEEFEEVKVTIEETNFITVISNEEILRNFKSGSSATKTFRIFLEDNLPQGNIDIPLSVSTELGVFEYEKRVFVQDAQSRPELYIGGIESTPQELLPDTNDNKVMITIANLGDKDAELVKATLVSDESIIKPSYSYSLEDSVASINSGNQIDLTFTIDIEETTLNEIPSTLKLQYRSVSASSNTYEVINTEIPFNLELIEAPLLKVVEVKHMDDFMGGTTENKIMVGIKNEGTVEAEEVRVRLVPDISYPFIFELTTRYVSSSIQPGETAYVSFITEVQDSAESKEYPITAKLESLIGETRYVREDTVVIETIPGKELPIKLISIIIIALIIISAVAIGITTYRKNHHVETYRARRQRVKQAREAKKVK